MLIKKYTSNWITYFLKLKHEIENGLIGVEYKIEHIGSTSIPKLDSKPIIDIDIIYENKTEFEIIKSRLIKIGYYQNGNQGINKRDVFKRSNKSNNQVLDTIPHHIYVCLKGSKALERHILSRNFMKKNDWARLEYQKIKYEIAKKANQNKKLYAELKEIYVNDFIDSIIEREKNEHNHNISKYFI